MTDGVRGAPAPSEEVVRVVLVGFMGAGKSTVGPRLAERLGWRFVDLDGWIEEREGRPVHRIFDTDGEAYFRGLETAATAELAAADRLVLATGGGWVVTAGHLDMLGPGTLSVWLQLPAEVAVQRAAAAGVRRPLLDVPDPAATAARLLREREPLYARADLHLSTLVGDPGDVVRAIEHRILRRRGASPLRSTTRP